jgi:hypothetical protein
MRRGYYLIFKSKKEAENCIDQLESVFIPSQSGKSTSYASLREHAEEKKFAFWIWKEDIKHLPDDCEYKQVRELAENWCQEPKSH